MNIRIENHSCARALVDAHKEFQDRHGRMYGVWLASVDTTLPRVHKAGRAYSPPAKGMKKVYAVFSYGPHFPMYVWDKQACMWFGNRDKYSNTTTRQQAYCLPTMPIPESNWLSISDMRGIVAFGGIGAYMIEKTARTYEGHDAAREGQYRTGITPPITLADLLTP